MSQCIILYSAKYNLDTRTNCTLKNPYDPTSIEQKWQKRWEEQGTNTLSEQELRDVQDPYYNLMMFPYPSAEGLHIGNIYAYTGADVQGRFQRLLGKTVFEPIGFDAFGIHSENFALKTGTNPNELIPQNIANFTQQLKRFGGMFDWTHTVDTTDPEYYQWTQWIFVQLFKAGLIERREAAVNWCPSCMTVLANEQVINGFCERCDAKVGQRQLPQWFVKITKYAKRLLKNIDGLDWSPTTKVAQTNWIGASTGAHVRFKHENFDDSIEVFTTRPDTLFGATYLVLSPEHDCVDIVTIEEQRNAVSRYLSHSAQQDIVERQLVDREKTGVFTGSYCINPATKERIPIWIADYVLVNYGTGAIMAVPGHDQRDFEFATKFDLPIRRVIAEPGANNMIDLIAAYEGDGTLVNSSQYDGLLISDAKEKVVAWLHKDNLAEVAISYRLHDWCISRQRYWGPPIPIIHCSDCGPVVVPEKDLPVRLPYLEDFRPVDRGASPLSRDPNWVNVSCPTCGKAARRETDVSDTFLDSAWYFLRYPCTDTKDQPFNPDILHKWLPVTSYIGGNEHAVLHMLYSRFLTMALYDMGILNFEEPYKKFRAHGLLIRGGRKISKSRGNVIVPDSVISEFGADTVRMYLMFLGPFEQGGDYREEGIQGPFKFLNRLWQSVQEAEPSTSESPLKASLHRTIKQVTDAVSQLRYNTAIAAMMEYLNEVRAGGRTPLIAEVEPLVVLVAPFCPHIAEELHEQLGRHGGLFDRGWWPLYDAALLKVETVSIPVSVNGKRRVMIDIKVDSNDTEVVEIAKTQPNLVRYLEGVNVKRTIYVKNRMLNFVTSPVA